MAAGVLHQPRIDEVLLKTCPLFATGADERNEWQLLTRVLAGAGVDLQTAPSLVGAGCNRGDFFARTYRDMDSLGRRFRLDRLG